ncbi:MAG: lysylphosphatidylglycerol synthase transmembrane domain-containing protein [Planctomycetota bacterium]
MNPTARRRAKRLIALAIAALLVWIAARTVPWRDQIRLHWQKGGPEQVWQGDLLGPWQADAVDFRLDEDVPAPVVGAPDLRAGSQLLVHGQGLRIEGESLEAWQVEWRPSLPRVLRELRWTTLAAALGLLFLSTLVIITRWQILLQVAGCPTRWFKVLHVTYVGLFFNLILPGVSGGDLARAYYMVKGHPERRAAAVMSVFMDRVLGLFAMALVASVAIYWNDERMASLRLPVLGVTAAMALGGLVLIHPWLRKHLPVERLISRLPAADKLQSLDDAVRLYGHHPVAVGVSILLSMVTTAASTALFLLGRAMGIPMDCCSTMSASARSMRTPCPRCPCPREGSASARCSRARCSLAGGSYTIGVAVSITYRLCMFFLGLLGGLGLLVPGGTDIGKEFRQAEEQGEGFAAPS